MPNPMSNKPILIHEKYKTDWESREILKAAETLGWDIKQVYIEDLKGLVECEGRFIPQGYIEFTTEAINQLKDTFVDVRLPNRQDSFNLVNLPEKWLKREIYYTQSNFIRSILEKPCFIKPIPDKKFEAKVYSSRDELPAEMTEFIYLSEPVEFILEVRCYVHTQRLRTWSPYAAFGKALEIVEDDEVLYDKAESALKDSCYSPYLLDNFEESFNGFLDEVDLPPAVVVDFGYIKDRGWAIIEFNNVYSSGLYDCSAVEVLKCIERSVLK